jgi:hypothetical protein
MIGQHINHNQAIAAGAVIPAGEASSFATTQAVWRFLNNEKITPQQLVYPLREFVREQVLPKTDYVLCTVDWSHLNYAHHDSKTDKTQLSHKTDIGYDLTAMLAVDAESGKPMGLIQAHLKTAYGFETTSDMLPAVATSHLDQVLTLMEDAKNMNLGATPVTIIDREADAVYYMRQWASAGHKFLVRCDDRCVNWQAKEISLDKIRKQAEVENLFTYCLEFSHEGQKVLQYVYETDVVLSRPARRNVKNKRFSVPGEPLQLRLLIAKLIVKETGEELRYWYLLTNVPRSDVSSAQIALWYYYRWNIESYFKLMKAGGQELEHWQQESALAILKRLLVASMAAAMVWRLQRNTSPEAEELKKVLTQLSGKSHKRGRPPTAGILISGLFVLLQILDYLDAIGDDLNQITKLRSLLKKCLPNFVKNV